MPNGGTTEILDRYDSREEAPEAAQLHLDMQLSGFAGFRAEELNFTALFAGGRATSSGGTYRIRYAEEDKLDL